MFDIIKEFCYPCTAKSRIVRVLKFAVYHNKLLTGIIFSLILKNKMLPHAFLQRVCWDFSITPLEQKLLYVEVLNLQDMFII